MKQVAEMTESEQITVGGYERWLQTNIRPARVYHTFNEATGRYSGRVNHVLINAAGRTSSDEFISLPPGVEPDNINLDTRLYVRYSGWRKTGQHYRDSLGWALLSNWLDFRITTLWGYDHRENPALNNVYEYVMYLSWAAYQFDCKINWQMEMIEE